MEFFKMNEFPINNPHKSINSIVLGVTDYINQPIGIELDSY